MQSLFRHHFLSLLPHGLIKPCFPLMCHRKCSDWFNSPHPNPVLWLDCLPKPLSLEILELAEDMPSTQFYGVGSRVAFLTPSSLSLILTWFHRLVLALPSEAHIHLPEWGTTLGVAGLFRPSAFARVLVSFVWNVLPPLFTEYVSPLTAEVPHLQPYLLEHNSIQLANTY